MVAAIVAGLVSVVFLVLAVTGVRQVRERAAEVRREFTRLKGRHVTVGISQGRSGVVDVAGFVEEVTDEWVVLRLTDGRTRTLDHRQIVEGPHR